MKKLSETAFTKRLKDRYEAAGYLVHKTSDRFSKGWPDLQIVKGHTIYIEVKVDPNDLSPLQRETLTRLARAGAEAWVVWYSHRNGLELWARASERGEFVPGKGPWDSRASRVSRERE